MKSTEVKSWKCSGCGKCYKPKDVADRCCCCSKCGKESEEGSRNLIIGMCRGCYHLHLVERYEKADAVPSPAGIPCLYSCELNEFVQIDDVEDFWANHVYDIYDDEEAKNREDDPIGEIRKSLRLYVCRPDKPHWPGVSEMWCDHLPGDCEAGPPGDHEKVDEVMEKYLSECGPWCYSSTMEKWNGEIEEKE